MPNTIKVKRGKSAALNTSTEKLQAGEILYNLDKNYLTVGAEDNDALTKKPVAAREIVGYTGDTDSKIGTSTTEAYSIKYDTQLKIKDGNNTLLVPKKDGTLATTDDITTSASTKLDNTGDDKVALKNNKSLSYTSEAIASTVMSRDANGRAKVADGAADQDIATVGQLNAELGNYYTKTESDARYSQATNLENGTGIGSLVQKRLKSDGVTWTTTKAYQGASTALGGGTQAGRTEEDFNAYFWDSATNKPLHGGSKNSSGEILDNHGLTYKKSYSFGVAEGEQTKALGRGSHSEGYYTETKEEYSHAEGWKTVSRGLASHAEGNTTQTIGRFSHAEGSFTTSKGAASHAEGMSTEAIGDNSHTEGFATRALEMYQHVEGVYNADNSNALHIVGNGTSENARKNAFVVLKDGRAKVQSAPVEDDDVVRQKELDDLSRKKLNFPETFDYNEESVITINDVGWVDTKKVSDFIQTTGGTITGSLTISQNLIVNGTTSTVEAENLKVADKLVYVAKDNTVALTSPAGLITPKYDGTNNGGIVYDNTGTAYVGDIALDSNGNVDVNNSDLQPIATRNATITNGNIIKWDDTKKTLVDSGKSVNDLSTATNLENGTGQDSLVQKYVKNDVDHSSIATGVGSVAFGGLRFDYDPEKHSGDKTNTAAGNQSFVTGCGNYTAGDWSFVTGKDNTVYSNRAFVSGGANVSHAIDSEGNLLEEKTNVGRFNAIFGNNNTFKSSDTSKESNLIAGGSNTVDTERSIVVGYNNNVAGHYDAIFGFTNIVNADYSLTGGRNHVVNGAYHLVAGSGNEVSGQYNIASGQDNNNAGWNSAVIGRGLIVRENHTAQTILGQYNDNKSDTVLEIGWGDSNNRKNIFEVYKDGVVKTEKGTLSTEEYARSYTDSVVAPLKKLNKLNIGTNNTDADADNSLTVGLHALNRGVQSAAIGYDAYVGYDKSSKPISNRPTGAIALGWSRANADYSLSAGHDTEVNHQWSAALNNNTKTGANSQTVIGSYNAAKTTTAFEVGNGTLDHRSNAFEVLFDGRAKVQSAPTESDDVVRKKEIDTKLNLSEFSVLTQSQVDSLF